jgi:hypothetical protein
MKTWLIWLVTQNLRDTPLLPKSFRDEGDRRLSLDIISELRLKHSRFRGSQCSQTTARRLRVGGEPNLPFCMHECFKLSKLISKVCQAWQLITTTTQSWVSNPQNLWKILNVHLGHHNCSLRNAYLVTSQHVGALETQLDCPCLYYSLHNNSTTAICLHSKQFL